MEAGRKKGLPDGGTSGNPRFALVRERPVRALLIVQHSARGSQGKRGETIAARTPTGSLREGETTLPYCRALPTGRSVSGLGDKNGLWFFRFRRPRPLAWAVVFQAFGLNGGSAFRAYPPKPWRRRVPRWEQPQARR